MSWCAPGLTLGYEPVSTVVAPGQFARRGGILDIWTSADAQPVRLEFFGDEIDTLRRFDPATQRTIQSLQRLPVTPAREYLVPPGEAEPVRVQPAPAPPHWPASLLDYLPRQALVATDDLQAVRDTVLEVEEQAVGLRKDYIEDGELPDDFPVPYLTWSELDDALAAHQTAGPGAHFR